MTSKRGRVHPALEVLVVAVVYYAAARLGLLLAFERTNASPVWPPSGIALAAVLMCGHRALAGIALGAFVANAQTFLANQAAAPATLLAVSAFIAIGNALEAITGATLMRRFVGGDDPFARAQDVFKFVGIAFVMSAVSASIGPAALVLGGMAPLTLFAKIWLTWWMGDTAGVLVLAPAALAWRSPSPARWSPGRIIEALLLFILIVVATRVAFEGWLLGPEISYPLTFVPLPLLGWTALRFGPRESTIAVAVVSAMSIHDTMIGVGPFAREDVNTSLLLLQAFIGIVTVTTLAMTSMVAERQRAQQLAVVRASQQAVVAALGRASLAEGGLHAFLRDVAAQAARTLDNEVCGIFEMTPDGSQAVLKAAHGWPPGNAGRLVIEAGPGTFPGCAFASDGPLIIADFATDSRFDGSPIARASGCVGGVGVAIAGDGGRPHGVLLVCAARPRTFTPDDIGFLQSLGQLVVATIRRKTAVEELARSNAELEQFAYAASHDLQEPLRTIASYTQLLQRRYRDRLDADANEFIDLTVEAAARMKALIQAVMEHSRIGGHRTTIRPLDTERLLGRTLSNLAATISEKEAVVTHDELAPVLGDETLLVQLFQNLLGNAIKFSGARRPIVHVSSRRNGGEVAFSIKDNGIGIEPKHIEAIFLMFRRLHTAGEYPGAGVGLAICRKIVQRHGGRIWAESTPGEGSTFTFTLPAAEGPAV